MGHWWMMGQSNRNLSVTWWECGHNKGHYVYDSNIFWLQVLRVESSVCSSRNRQIMAMRQPGDMLQLLGPWALLFLHCCCSTVPPSIVVAKPFTWCSWRCVNGARTPHPSCCKPGRQSAFYLSLYTSCFISHRLTSCNCDSLETRGVGSLLNTTMKATSFFNKNYCVPALVWA